MTARQKAMVQETREKANNGDSSESQKRVEYLTAKQLAEVLQISESTIRKLRREGKIPAVMLTDRLIRFNLKDVKQALRASQTNTHSPNESRHPQEPDPQLSFDDLFKTAE